MREADETLNEEVLRLQNALITQYVDQTKLKMDVDELSERADFYEKLYNKTRKELYELENDCIDKFGSVFLIKVVLGRLKAKILRGGGKT